MTKRTPEEVLSGPYGSAPRAADRIFDTACELFYREGIRAVGVDEIVTRAGVTKPSLYRSYKSKDELVAAVLRQVEAGFWERFEAAEQLHPGDPKAQMVAYFQGLADRSGGDDYRGCNLSNARWSNIPIASTRAARSRRSTSSSCASASRPRRPRWARATRRPWAMR
ncbi:TetR/AcrR family transcriptional regulator [Caulobacter segnis]|uniref:TetR/AcrR family transcriptional regulator n=1 Tax=Caulobacter segnis TaxID=88688 RepID=UPI000303896A|nr:TetR/AcrR family transcriptional regulator [Caulobacter segnis]